MTPPTTKALIPLARLRELAEPTAQAWCRLYQIDDPATLRDLRGAIASYGEMLLQHHLPGALPPWQPIESCPKDGTWFLAWDADVGFYVYRDGPGFIAGSDPSPTHWMPLPAAPERSK